MPGLNATDDTIQLLAQIGDETSLRCAVLPPSACAPRPRPPPPSAHVADVVDARLCPSEMRKRLPRYAVQLMTPSSVLARTRGRDAIAREDVEESRLLFFDAKASARVIVQNAGKYIS